MKTTIEIAGDQLVEEALRQRLARPNAAQPFRLKKYAFAGDGRGAVVAEGQWETVRDLAYRLG